MRPGACRKLKALQLHNGTVYRWNRPCYGVGGGKPHLRIECRVVPSGPTVLDEVANAAFWAGADDGACGAGRGHLRARSRSTLPKRTSSLPRRLGLRAGFYWLDGESVSAQNPAERIRLLPMSRRGLEMLEIDSDDIDRYLGVIRARVSTLGPYRGVVDDPVAISDACKLRWVSAWRHSRRGSPNDSKVGRPVSEWTSGHRQRRLRDWKPNFKTVEQYMTTTLFTVE